MPKPSKLLRSVATSLFWAILPGTCTACGLDTGRRVDLCRHCQAALPVPGPRCRRCGLPGHAAVCRGCRRRPPPWQRLVCAGPWEDPYPRWVGGLKYRGDTAAARLLGWLLADAVACSGAALPDAVVPVPLHPWRRLQRGFNQAELIAQYCAAPGAGPVLAGSIRRRRWARPQAGLSARQRGRNLGSSAFAAHLPPGVRHVALVDDVLTTGSTALACCAALRAAGAERVDVWVVARADPPPVAPQRTDAG